MEYNYVGESLPPPPPFDPAASGLLNSNSPTMFTGSPASLTNSPTVNSQSPGPGATDKKKAPKKRKSSAAAGEDDEDELDEDGNKKKRIKTPRACDQCRRKKIRCDAIADTNPPICVHCRSHNTNCSWILPISMTRFARSKAAKDDDASHHSGASTSALTSSAASLLSLNQPHPVPHPPMRQSSLHGTSASPPVFNHLGHPAATSPGVYHSGHSNASSPDNPTGGAHRREPRIMGPTSIGHIMHSTSTFPVERMAPVDFKYRQELNVNETGDGFITIVTNGDGEGVDHTGEPLAIQGIEKGDAEKLLNYYFATHSSHFPIVSKADFLSSETPSPLLFNTLCGISALSHHVSPSILRTIKGTIRHLIRDDDVLDNSSISTIQALLIYSFSLELEKGNPGSKSWNAVGLAIRMAQDLGLHRKLGSEVKEQSESDHTELRRRVWGGCLIADRWIAAIYGQPMMIDLADCDCLLPSVFDIRPNLQFDAERRPYLFNGALLALSILLGRILKMVYSPTGIMTLSSQDADALISDLDSWLESVPEELKFEGPEKSSSSAGFLHLLYIPVRFLCTRPFMRVSFQLPERFANISVGIEQWNKMEKESREAIEWVDRNEACLEGWFVGIYAFFIASLIMYHSHIRRRDARSLDTLRLARDTLKRLVVAEGECYARSKISEIVHLLYHTACSVQKWAPENAEGVATPPSTNGSTGHASVVLNPTVGVRQRQAAFLYWHPPRARPGMQAAYSSSLRSTHVPGEAEPETSTFDPVLAVAAPVDPIASSTDPNAELFGFPTDALNFNPTLNAPGDDFLNGGLFDLNQSIFPPEGVLDWDSWSTFFNTTGTSTI
ncbi:nitrogen assimilation transcription factor [Pseudohyphozyma bogoriensis]|nr:nitrogen assimilation transcription factor [Pseudohyphozyma bogoriensis]